MKHLLGKGLMFNFGSAAPSMGDLGRIETSMQPNTKGKAMMRQLTLMVLAGVVWTVGCSTTRQERSGKAASSMADLREVLVLAEQDVDKVQRATEALVKADVDDLRKEYDRFASAVHSMRSIANKVRGESKAMRDHTRSYFKNWQNEISDITNKELKSMSRERQSQLNQAYGLISAAMDKLAGSYAVYEQDVADLERFLGNDLTRVGGDLAQPYLNKLATKADRVKKDTVAANEAVANLEHILAPR